MTPAPNGPATQRARKAAVPIAPVLSRAGLGLRRGAAVPCLLEGEPYALTGSGRAALALALRHLGVGPGDEVLVPAYHCVAMIGPITSLGATPRFYRMQADLSVQLEDLRRRATERTRAVLGVHYFGFIQDLTELRSFCDSTGIALIEDCAHAFYGERNGTAVGRFGDLAIGSLIKFFPVFDGGCLVSYRRHLSDVELHRNGVASSLKAAVNMLERGLAFADSSFWRRVPAAAASLRRVRSGRSAAYIPSAGEGGFGFDPSQSRRRMTWPSRLVWRLSDQRRLIQRRRGLYAAYLRALADLPGGRPLYGHLPDGVVPYVFPYVLNDPGVSFDALWNEQIPLYRWEDVAGDVCPVSSGYRSALIQFPCHQELSDEQAAWIIRRASQVLSGPGQSARVA